jgi:hypothetical protein
MSSSSSSSDDVSLSDNMSSSGDDDSSSDHVPVSPPDAKRQRLECFLEEPFSSINSDVSNLYTVLVPQGTTSGIDYHQVVGLATLTWYRDDKWMDRPDDCNVIGRMIDMVQLAHTCKHAKRNIRTRALIEELVETFGAIETMLNHSVFLFRLVRITMGPQSIDDFTIVERRLYAAYVAAYVGREHVARLVAPRGLLFNPEAIACLAPHRWDTMPPSTVEALRATPIFWWVHEDRRHYRRDIQFYFWLLMAIDRRRTDIVHDVWRASTSVCFFDALNKVGMSRIRYLSAHLHDVLHEARKLSGTTRVAYIKSQLLAHPEAAHAPPKLV